MMNQALPLVVIMCMAGTAFLMELNSYEKRITILMYVPQAVLHSASLI